jgi:F-type H+-transporting ATPase subunit epsilon
MAATYFITLLTPEGKLHEGRASAVVAPGVVGSFGVLANHQPMIAALQAGPLQITAEDGKLVYFKLTGGLLEVTAYHDVIVIADAATPV